MHSKKIKLIFDGRILKHLDNKNPSRSGIFFSAYNLFLEFQKRYDFYLYSDIASDYITRKKFPHISHLSKRNYRVYLISYLFFLFNRVRLPKILSKFFSAFLLVLGRVKLDYLNLTKDGQKVVFFSPFMAVPKEFLSDSYLRFTLLHDCIPLVFDDFPKQNLLRKLLGGGDWFSLLIASLNSKDFYFANSEYTKQDFLKFFPHLRSRQITVSYLAADKNTFCCNKDDELNLAIRQKYNIPQGKYIFSLCTLDKRKNLLFAIECFIAYIKENKIDDLVFVLGGGHYGEFREILRSRVPDEYAHKIIFTGYLLDNELSNLFSHAICSVYLSIYEGILESMQCGCPVIAANTTSLPEVLGDGGILVEPTDALALKKAYGVMYGNENLREELRQKGLKWAQSFSWGICADIMEEMIKKKYYATKESH